MTNRDYSLNFLTTAELSGAKAAESAVDKVGDAAARSGDKLDAFEEEWKASLERIKGKVDAMQNDLRDSGEKSGKATGEGMGQGINLAANMHLIGKAWEIGSMVGQILGKGMETAYDGTWEELKTSILAGMGFQFAIAEQELAKMQATLPAKHRDINAAILREYRAFWDDYNDAKPQTAGEWLDELATKADLAATKLRGLNEVTQQAMKNERSDIENDFLDKKQGIEKSSDPESVKLRKIAAAEAEKRQREASLREFERAEKAQALGEGQKGKEDQLTTIKQQEAEQLRRAEAYTRAKAQAEDDVAKRKAGGQEMSKEDERDTRAQAFNGMGRNYGIKDLSQDRDEEADLKALKARREALEKEVEKSRIETRAKQQALALEGEGDKGSTQSANARAEREAQDKIHEARRKEMDQEAATRASEQADQAKASQEAKAALHPPPPPPAPGQEQAPAGDLSKQITQASQLTNDPGLKMALEELKRGLADGASSQELKEAAALMQRASTDRSEAMSAVVAAVRSTVETTASALTKIRGEMDSLRASVESLKK